MPNRPQDTRESNPRPVEALAAGTGVGAADRKQLKRDRWLAGAVSVLAHGLIVFGVMSLHAASPREYVEEPVPIAMFAKPEIIAARPAAPAASAAAEKPPPTQEIVRPTPRPPPPTVKTLVADKEEEEEVEPTPELSDGQIAGAATAGSGGTGSGGAGGGSCDMIRWLQAALRKDHMVQSAVAEAHRNPGASGKPLWVWNGDWIRSHGQEGEGLAAVRQAIIWEVAFSPAACRAQSMRGLVMISMDDSPRSARIVVGSEVWRWSDLTVARSLRR